MFLQLIQQNRKTSEELGLVRSDTPENTKTTSIFDDLIKKNIIQQKNVTWSTQLQEIRPYEIDKSNSMHKSSKRTHGKTLKQIPNIDKYLSNKKTHNLLSLSLKELEETFQLNKLKKNNLNNPKNRYPSNYVDDYDTYNFMIRYKPNKSNKTNKSNKSQTTQLKSHKTIIRNLTPKKTSNSKKFTGN